MAKINTAGSGHGNKTIGIYQFFEYADKAALGTLKKALYILEHNIKGMRPCNACFKALPGGRSFDDVLTDNSVWISHDPTNHGAYGVTSGNDVSISKLAFDGGRWVVAATLVHELAHVNGAPGHTTAQAEATLSCCGLRAHDTGVIGTVQNKARNAYA